MTIDRGSLILIDYTAKVKDSDAIFDTTIEADAEKHSIHDPTIKYQPKLVSIQEPNFPVLQGLDETLSTAKVGEKLTVEVSPEKGFGQRDSGKIRMIPLRKLGEDAEKVSVDDAIEIDGKKGIVRFIGSGRVQVDYNHRYAGKTIVYDVEIKQSLDTDEDKASAILKHRLPVENSTISFQKTDNGIDVNIPEKLFRIDALQNIKYFVQLDLFKFIPSLEKINFIETHSNQNAKSVNTAKQEKPTESKPVEQKPTESKPAEQKTS